MHKPRGQTLDKAVIDLGKREAYTGLTLVRLSRVKRIDDVLATAEGFNDWGGRGYDYFIPGEITKQPLPGMRLHNPLHGQQACPEFIVFDQRVG